jgi:hypothetical protein
MSLDFNFGPQNHPRWVELFKKFGRLDKQFFYDVLPWLCMSLRIGYISEETIPHFLSRADVNNAVTKNTGSTTLREQLIIL